MRGGEGRPFRVVLEEFKQHLVKAHEHGSIVDLNRCCRIALSCNYGPEWTRFNSARQMLRVGHVLISQTENTRARKYLLDKTLIQL